MYGTFWLFAGLVGIVIIFLADKSAFKRMVKGTNFLILFGLMILGILSGGLTLVLGILYAGVMKLTQ